MSVLDADLSAWKAPSGLLMDGLGVGYPSGNAVLYMGHYALIQAHLGEPVDQAWIDHCYRLVQAVHNNTGYYGLIDRKPGAPDPQAYDDYLGLVVASPMAAAEVLHYGRTHNWNYNNVDPEANSFLDIILQKCRFWHRRLPGFVEHLKLANGEQLNNLEWSWWLLGILSTAAQGDGSSGMLKALLKLYTARHHDNWFTQTAKAAFNWRLNKGFNGNIQTLYLVYFKANHPYFTHSASIRIK